MAKQNGLIQCRSALRSQEFLLRGTYLLRFTSSAAFPRPTYTELPANGVPNRSPTGLSPVSRLTTSVLLRRLFMCKFFTSPLLFKPGLAIMNIVANSKIKLLNPDANPLLRRIIKPLVYDQFCAGTNHTEIKDTVNDIKSLGFSGVALCYGKEAQADQFGANDVSTHDPELAQWRQGTLETLDMVGSGDWLGLKMTGAGNRVMNALLQNETAPPEFVEAMDAICAKAAQQGCRIWIDAEHQAVQGSIDSWTFDLARKWNKSTPLLYNTVQAYLKESRPKLERQLRMVADEGWVLGVKLVRGAYIVHDRSKIHDTKVETDNSYNGIVHELLHGTFPGLQGGRPANFELLLCGHNPTTISTASNLAQTLSETGKLRVRPEFAQLQGMGDDVGLELIKTADGLKQQHGETIPEKDFYSPRVYKCLTWGSIQECMQYLVRRAVENRGALDRIKDDSSLFTNELRRRFSNAFRTQ